MMPYDGPRIDPQTERPVASTFDRGLARLVAQALSEKSLTWFSAVGSLAVWGLAVWHPEPLRLAAAAGYSLICHAIPLFRGKS